MLRKCKHHGQTEFRKTKTAQECKACYAERQCRMRRSKKSTAVALLGGECSICGYSKCESALDFHHKDPEQKDKVKFVDIRNKSLVNMLEELKKCILVCANCHREIHSELLKIS